MTVGRVYSTTMNHPSGITEVLLEKAKRDLDEVNKELDAKMVDFDELFDEAEKIRIQRDHYKRSLEEISSSIEDWLNSLIQEPSLDFIHAIKAWADKKLKEIV